ncbi:MAG TPA: CsgG/HfaB family protein [Sphingomonas sp.]|nr:CsgG/HfaB family protein [Sphingomonas sp.]
MSVVSARRTAMAVLGSALALAGCAANDPSSWSQAQPTKRTPMTVKLEQLPLPGDRVAVAVYNFTDQTGQFKPTEGVQTLSRAVTQGATSILVKALQEVGNHGWFTVIERERLDNLLRERAVIREMRAAYLGEKTLNRQALPPLLFAGILLEGGIIGYDSNTKSGGLGARFLGIGGSTQYREDTVTVYLRAVSVKTGEVLSTISVRKSIASIGLDANTFRYVAFKDLLELEAGVAYNEPDALALQQAIEAAVYGLVIEGASTDLWCIATTPQAGEALLRSYYAQRDNIDEAAVLLPHRTDGSTITGACPPRSAFQPAQRLAQQPAGHAKAAGSPSPTLSYRMQTQPNAPGAKAPAPRQADATAAGARALPAQTAARPVMAPAAPVAARPATAIQPSPTPRDQSAPEGG